MEKRGHTTISVPKVTKKKTTQTYTRRDLDEMN
jgi:hypothetical protein